VRRLVAVACLVAGLTAAGCGTVPARHYFTLSYPMDQDRVSASRPALHPVRLRLKPFKIALPYDRPQIVYRQSPYEYQYYAYRLWASKPQHMVREIVQAHLESARLVEDISREYGERMPDYELSAEVLAIEEYDSGDVWYGHLAIRFELTRFKDKLVIWHYGFDRQRKVHKKQPVFVVRSLSRVLEEEMARVAAEMDAVLAAERGVKATLPMPAPADDSRPAEEDGRGDSTAETGGPAERNGTGGAKPRGSDQDLIEPEAN